MNTVNMRIKHADLSSFIKDVKRMRIKHYPFQHNQGHYDVELWPDPAVDILVLKYPMCVIGKIN